MEACEAGREGIKGAAVVITCWRDCWVATRGGVITMDGVMIVEVENSVAVTALVLVEVRVLTTSFPLNVREMRVVSVSVRVVR